MANVEIDDADGQALTDVAACGIPVGTPCVSCRVHGQGQSCCGGRRQENAAETLPHLTGWLLPNGDVLHGLGNHLRSIPNVSESNA